MRYALIALLLTGCATTGGWYHPTKREPEFRQDAKECQYEAAKAAAAVINPFDAGAQRGSLERMCLEVRGYTWLREKPAP